MDGVQGQRHGMMYNTQLSKSHPPPLLMNLPNQEPQQIPQQAFKKLSAISDNDQNNDEKVVQQKYIDSYMNANYINGLVRGFSDKSVIAAMAPKEKTLCKFWQMIWQNKVNLIVMLCPFYKGEQEVKGMGSREECINYWKELQEVGHVASIKDNKNQVMFELKLIDKKQLKPSMELRRF